MEIKKEIERTFLFEDNGILEKVLRDFGHSFIYRYWTKIDDSEEIRYVKYYNKNPKIWGKKMGCERIKKSGSGIERVEEVDIIDLKEFDLNKQNHIAADIVIGNVVLDDMYGKEYENCFVSVRHYPDGYNIILMEKEFKNKEEANKYEPPIGITEITNCPEYRGKNLALEHFCSIKES